MRVVRVDVYPSKALWVLLNSDSTGFDIFVNKLLVDAPAATSPTATATEAATIDAPLPPASGVSPASAQPQSAAPVAAAARTDDDDATTVVVTITPDTAATPVAKGFKAFVHKVASTQDRGAGQDKGGAKAAPSVEKKPQKGKKVLKRFALKVEAAKEKLVKLFTDCVRPACVEF